MAIYNEILAARYARMLQKLFSMKGEAPTRQLAGEIMPVFPFFNGIENRYLEGWETFGISMSPTGGAAQSAATRLRNPSGSNVFAVVHGLILSAAAAANISVVVATNAADLTSVQSVTNARLDTRGRPQPSLIPSSTTNFGAVPAVSQWFANFAAGAFQLIQDSVQEILVLPGQSLDVIDNTLAANMSISYLWRERTSEESERT